MTRFIVSRTSLFITLMSIERVEAYRFVFFKKEEQMLINGAGMHVTCDKDGEYMVEAATFNRLLSFLRERDEQPMTLAVGENGWITIKEAFI